MAELIINIALGGVGCVAVGAYSVWALRWQARSPER